MFSLALRVDFFVGCKGKSKETPKSNLGAPPKNNHLFGLAGSALQLNSPQLFACSGGTDSISDM